VTSRHVTIEGSTKPVTVMTFNTPVTQCHYCFTQHSTALYLTLRR